jgi:hypothetical protein
MLPIGPIPPPPVETVALIASAFSLAAFVVLFLETIVNHMLAPGVRPVTV